MRRVVVFFLMTTMACGAGLFHAPAGAAVSVQYYERDGSNGVWPDAYGFLNNQGVFYIAQTCFREPSISEPTQGVAGWDPYDRQADGVDEVGPGYIFAAASRRYSWNTKTRDYLDVTMSDTRSGGWAKFGAHVARTKGYAGRGVPNGFGAAMKEVQTGLCLDSTKRGYNGKNPDDGAGVSSTSVSGPAVQTNGEYAFTLTTTLNDGLANILRVTHDYRIGDNVIRVWTTVTNLCPSGGGCDGAGPIGNTVYVKEPKFVVGDYKNDHPYSVLEVANVFPWGGWSVCGAYNQNHPPTQTVQCTDPYRQQLWLKENATGAVSSDCVWGCTWVVGKAVNASTGGLTYWGGGYGGLDRWAAYVFGQTGNSLPNRDQSTGCSTTHRSWELGRWSPTPDGWTATQAGFMAWTGGSGLMACQNLFKNPGPATSYSNYFEFQLVFP